MEALNIIGYALGGASVALSATLIGKMFYNAIKHPLSAVPHKPSKLAQAGYYQPLTPEEEKALASTPAPYVKRTMLADVD